MAEELLLQVAKAVGYYVALILILRVAGKRLAGQTTTFDLIVLITLAVVIHFILLSTDRFNWLDGPGRGNSVASLQLPAQ